MPIETVKTLPIDELLPEIARVVQRERVLVLEAPPGAGKTTRVPWALLEALTGEIVVAQPRRLAARLTATRVAHERGERLGGRIGYSVRFEDVSSKATRLRFVTEGVLLRRLLTQPTLPGVECVVLDEFHERSLNSDVLLALLQRLRRNQRPDLALIVMSATLDAAPIAELLAAPRVNSEARVFPVEIEHAPAADERPLDKRVAGAVRAALSRDDGDVLVFLPGSGEIRRCLSALEMLAREQQLLLLPLHGDLPVSEQARAVEPSTRRKVVLSTNVAETSVTIDGVTAVIDSGLARLAQHSPWSGLSTLTTVKISRASAVQRAGRAGRTREGRVLRLYTKGDFDTRREHEPPEIARADLSEARLLLTAAGIVEIDQRDWLTPPTEAAWNAASALLEQLRALTKAGALTELGRAMLELPVHPRLARVALRGAELGAGEEACLAAALLSERDIRSEARLRLGRSQPVELGASGPCDVLELMERFAEAEAVGLRADALRHAGLDVRTVAAVEATRSKLVASLRIGARPQETQGEPDAAVRRAILSGFADRVGKRRRAGEPEIVLAQGGSARISPQSVVHTGELVVGVAAEEIGAGLGRSLAQIKLATSIEPDWLLEDFPERIELRDDLVWNPQTERVERVEGMAYGAIMLDESRRAAAPSEQAARLLEGAAKSRGQLPSLSSGSAGALVARVALLREHFGELALPDFSQLGSDHYALALCRNVTSLKELAELDPARELHNQLDYSAQRLLQTEAPEHVSLSGGRRVAVHYEPNKPPWIESRLQDFFGMQQGPKICAGRVPLTLHLLAPSGRAQQVTSDLAGFWQRHYPSVRRELMRKYPRHAWPEDGATAAPPPYQPRGPRRP
jgi:ATP-dependent helicase HrpB